MFTCFFRTSINIHNGKWGAHSWNLWVGFFRALAAWPLEVHNTPSLAMGYVMETQLDTLETHICDWAARIDVGSRSWGSETSNGRFHEFRIEVPILIGDNISWQPSKACVDGFTHIKC